MTTELPAPIAAYIAATNRGDLEAMMRTFAEDALVNDHRNEFATHAAIRDWAQREIVGDRVTLQVTAAAVRGNAAAVTAAVAGDFDHTGLPDPLVLAFYFAFSRERIDQLVIVHNRPPA